MPLGLGMLGAVAGGILFASVGNAIANPAVATTTSSSTVVADNTQNANGLQTLPPPGA